MGALIFPRLMRITGCFAAQSRGTPIILQPPNTTRFSNRSEIFPQEYTRNDLRRSEIQNFPWGACPQTPLAGVLRALYILEPHFSLARTITVIQTRKNSINHWVLHSLLIVVLALELFFSDFQALRFST